jgi:hypothetical protein
MAAEHDSRLPFIVEQLLSACRQLCVESPDGSFLRYFNNKYKDII